MREQLENERANYVAYGNKEAVAKIDRALAALDEDERKTTAAEKRAAASQGDKKSEPAVRAKPTQTR